jgi:hypothetical protein
MNAQISSKLAAFAIALMMNAMIIAGVSYVFDAQMDQLSIGIADSGQRRPCGCTPHRGDCRSGAPSRLRCL